MSKLKKVSPKTNKIGNSTIISHVDVVPFSNDGIMVPLYLLDSLKVSDLDIFNEVALGYSDKDKPHKIFKDMQKFSDLRISFYPNTKSPSVEVSCIVMEPYDIQDLELGQIFEYQFQQILKGIQGASIWMPVIPPISKIKRDMRNAKKQNVSYVPVGYVGFSIYLKGTTFHQLLVELVDFLYKVDTLTRQVMFS